MSYPLRRVVGVERYAVVDVETSGLSTRWNRLLQVAVVTVDGDTIVDEWASLVRLRWPWQRVGPRRIHGIGRRDLRHAPTLHEVMGEVARRVDGAVFVAHNLEFDQAFLDRASRKARVALRPEATLCTLTMSRRLDPDRELSHRLGDVASRYGVVNDRPHDALHDARTTALILPKLLADSGEASTADYE